MYFDIVPTFLADYRRKKFVCKIFNREGVLVRQKRFKDIYEAHNWGYRKVSETSR